MSEYAKYPNTGGSGVASINGDTNSAQLIVGGTGISVATSSGTTTITNTSPSSGGTVTSVGLSAPSSILSVSGSPITSSGTISLSLTSQTANTVFAAPNGSNGVPSFRSLVSADIPALPYVTSVSLTMPGIFSVAGSPITSSGTLAVSLVSETANQVFASPSGSSGVPTFRTLTSADLPTSTANRVSFYNSSGVLTASDMAYAGPAASLFLPGSEIVFGPSGSTSNADIRCNNDTDSLALTGGGTGAQLILYGQTHATFPNQARFINGASSLVQGSTDANGKWTLGASGGTQVHVVNGSLAVTGATVNLSLGSLTASTALASDASKNIVSSTTTSTELGFVHGVTSAIQTQINGKASLTGANFTGTVSVASNATNQQLRVTSTNTGGTSLSLTNSSTGGQQWLVTSTGSSSVSGAGNFVITDPVSTNDVIFIQTATDFVGINTDTPSSRFTVNGDISTSGNVLISDIGGGISIAEGSNARMGLATLVAGTVTVSNTTITANTRIFLTTNAPSGTVGSPYVSATSAGVSFTITSTQAADTSSVAWLLIEHT